LFLQKVITAYPTGNIAMVLENARIHHTKLLKPFLEEQQGRIKLVFLPPFSPELNIVEGLWKWLRDSALRS